MKPVWTKAAIRELVHIREYIARDNADAAREIALRIVDAIGSDNWGNFRIEQPRIWPEVADSNHCARIPMNVTPSL